MIKHRLLGAVFILSLAIVIIPALLDDMPGDGALTLSNIPAKPSLYAYKAPALNAAQVNSTQNKNTVANTRSWVVDLGTLKNATQRVTLEKELRSLGFAAYSRNGETDGLPHLYVGAEKERKEADAMLKQLLGYGLSGQLLALLPT